MHKKVWNPPKMTQLNVAETAGNPNRPAKWKNKYESGRSCNTHTDGRNGSCS